MRPTYHMTPADLWAAVPEGATYSAPSLADEGFIHCTDGAANLVATANRHYRNDPRSYIVLTLDLDALQSPWRFDNDKTIYPHIYGPINQDAVLAVQPFPRKANGEFSALEDGG